MAEEKIYPQDVDGFDSVTNALMELVSLYPGLSGDGEMFQFSTVSTEDGLSIYPTNGAAIYESRESVTGKVRQMCEYPFLVLYKASGLTEHRKVQVKEWLDTFGRWLTKQPVVIGKKTYKLAEWPELKDGRKIWTIERQTPAYLSTTSDDKCDNWVMSMTLRYRNEFTR